MKKILLILLSFFSLLTLCACATRQTTASTPVNSATYTQQNINDTNYQEMMREQSGRMQATVPHIGGRR
ncbi:MAG TPA: hypothetical protein VLH77_02900 [Gammaproteobacteria bacterium]|nr:hypothetical protein [Gammaproteobacteria bacterium]